MNQIEHSILSRCLNAIYGELLTNKSDISLESMERLISLVRYMEDRESLQCTLGKELNMIQEVFRIYQQNYGVAELKIDSNTVDLQSRVLRTSVVYEVCQHGMELLHSGIPLEKITFYQKQGYLTYVFSDTNGKTYGGTIDGEETRSNTEPYDNP